MLVDSLGIERLRRELIRTAAGTISRYRLIESGDRILVAVSGGKDSYTLLDLLAEARRRAPVSFDLVAFHVDQAQPGYDGTPLRRWLEASGVTFEIHREDTYTAVVSHAEQYDERTYCRVCS